MHDVKFSVREDDLTHCCKFSVREAENSVWSKKPCAKYTLRARKCHFAHQLYAHSCKISYFRYKCEKVIVSSWGRLRPSEARVKRPHEDKITFSLAYRTQFFYTTCTKLDLTHAVLFERAQSGHFAHGV